MATHKLGIRLSEYDYEKLKKWAMTHGKTPSTFAAQIIASRLEANSELINTQYQDYLESLDKK